MYTSSLCELAETIKANDTTSISTNELNDELAETIKSEPMNWMMNVSLLKEV